jgi:hypothetical protein
LLARIAVVRSAFDSADRGASMLRAVEPAIAALVPKRSACRAVAVGRHRLKLPAVGGTQLNVGPLVHPSDSHTRGRQRMPKRIEMSDLVH